MARKKYVRCIATARDGTRCGRMAPADATPQVCAKHGSARFAGIVQSVEKGPRDVLRKLMNGKDRRVAIRAAAALARIENTTRCERCAAQAEADRERADLVSRLTPEQEQTVRDLIARVRAVLEEARDQPVLDVEPSAPVLDSPAAPTESEQQEPTADDPDPDDDLDDDEVVVE